eukprot:GFYU01017019.1.p1 GENE.GFYU01017019.1~~GFYU01017019.1.p1  ORF type:complete len:197 (-),score=28.52 GFYU01017019.1:173-715(-)
MMALRHSVTHLRRGQQLLACSWARQSYSTKITEKPAHVCVVGSGPSGFYTADFLLKNPNVKVDIIEMLPCPFGLVRFGVAPDHPEVKVVQNRFDGIAANDRCRYLGNVTVGKHVSIEWLTKNYSAVVLASGTPDDKLLGIPGEDLKGVYAARNFVGWYNGHPDDADLPFSLDHERVVVIG